MARFGQISNDPPENTREVLPIGDYVVKVEKLEKKKKEGGAHPYYNIEFIVVSGEHKNRHIWDNWSLAPKNYPMYKLKQLCSACLGDLDDVQVEVGNNAEFDEFMKQLKHKRLRVYVQHEPSYRDKNAMIERVGECFKLEDSFMHIEENETQGERIPF